MEQLDKSKLNKTKCKLCGNITLCEYESNALGEGWFCTYSDACDATIADWLNSYYLDSELSAVVSFLLDRYEEFSAAYEQAISDDL